MNEARAPQPRDRYSLAETSTTTLCGIFLCQHTFPFFLVQKLSTHTSCFHAVYACIASIKEERISVTILDGCAERSLKMFSTTEISVEVVSSPQNAHLHCQDVCSKSVKEEKSRLHSMRTPVSWQPSCRAESRTIGDLGAYQSLTASPAAITSLPRLIVPATTGTCQTE